MDKDVLIRFIEAVEKIFGRLNSKRLTAFFVYLWFLLQALNPLAIWCATAMFVFVQILLVKYPGGDKFLKD